MATTDIAAIEEIIQRLLNHEALPDDSGQGFIERVADPIALPVLRRAQIACLEYRQWAKPLDMTRPGLWAADLLALKLDSRLAKAIERCSAQSSNRPAVAPEAIPEWTASETRAPREIAGVRSLPDLCRQIADNCCEHSDGSGTIWAGRARDYFGQLDLGVVKRITANAPLAEVNQFVRLLDLISSDIGKTSCDVLERIREFVPLVSRGTITRESEQLAAARNAQEINQVLLRACFEHQDGSGQVATWAVPMLFEKLDPLRWGDALNASDMKRTAALTATVTRLRRLLHSPQAAIESLYEGLIDTGRRQLPHASQACHVHDIVAHICCENGDGSGRLNKQATARLLDGLDTNRMGERLSGSPIRDIHQLAAAVDRISEKLTEPRPSGFNGLLIEVDRAAALSATRVRPRLAAAASLREIKQVIIQACCEHDDSSGHSFATSLEALFKGFDVSSSVDVVRSAEGYEIHNLLRILDRIDPPERNGACTELADFRRLLKPPMTSIPGADDKLSNSHAGRTPPVANPASQAASVPQPGSATPSGSPKEYVLAKLFPSREAVEAAGKRLAKFKPSIASARGTTQANGVLVKVITKAISPQDHAVLLAALEGVAPPSPKTEQVTTIPDKRSESADKNWYVLPKGHKKDGPFSLEELRLLIPKVGMRIRRESDSEWVSLQNARTVYPELGVKPCPLLDEKPGKSEKPAPAPDSEQQVRDLIHQFLNARDKGAVIQAGYHLKGYGTAALEPLLEALGEVGMRQRLRSLQSRGEWREEDAGMLILELTKKRVS